MGNSSSSKAVAAASNQSNSTFDEAMCQRFNAFYDVDPLPEGRVRPKFEGSEPHLALVAHSNYASTNTIGGIRLQQITPDIQETFIKLFAQFEPFPTPLAGCLTDTTLKQLKQNNSDEFNKAQTYDTAKEKTDKSKFTLIMCKLKFLGFIVEYVTKPVVLEWDKYMKQKQGQGQGQGQTLSPDDEKQLSILLQIKLLEGMDNMIENTKGNATDKYVPTVEEDLQYEKFKDILVNLQQQHQSHPQSREMQSLGGSKYKRQSKRRKQRNQQKRRQRSKKYCK